MTRNPRMLDVDIPAYQLAKRARLDQLDREAQTESDHALQMLCLLIVLGVIVTACLLAWAWGGQS